jgi:Binding-protein-dependent transport system inner membrane component
VAHLIVWLDCNSVRFLPEPSSRKPSSAGPGPGRLVVTAISNRDYALVQGCLLSIGLTYVLVNLITDVVYRVVNPRMR